MPASNKDFYKVLDIDPKASADDIKKAYRGLAVKLHPDKYPGTTEAEIKRRKDAEAKFKDVSEAYATLGDAQKRQAYDFNRRPSYQFGGNGAPGGFGDFESAMADVFNLFTQAKAGKPAGKSAPEKLDYAVRYQTTAAVKNLIANGAVPDTKTLDYAVRYKTTDMVKTLLTTGLVPDPKTLDYAVRYKTTDLVKNLLVTGAVPNTKTLDYAVRYKTTDMVKTLLTTGLVPDPETLDYAVRYKTTDMVKALLVTGLVPNLKTLNYAMSYKTTDMVNVLSAARTQNKRAASQNNAQTAPPKTGKPSGRRFGFKKN